jgi:hypothetical protein
VSHARRMGDGPQRAAEHQSIKTHSTPEI